MGLIYKAINKINNKQYIGQTMNTLGERKKQHIQSAFNSRREPKSYFHKAIKKYGEENFKWEIIENNIPNEKLNERERYWIKFYNTYEDGYNLTEGGDSFNNLQKWRNENPDIAKESAKRGCSIMRSILDHNPEKEQLRKEKAAEGIKKYVEEHKEEWSKKSYETYLKHKEQVDKQFEEFHKKQSKQVKCLETGIIYASANEASRQTKISQGNISACCRGARLSAGKDKEGNKLHWQYI